MRFACTGGDGTIGQFLSPDIVRLKTRLEAGEDERVRELAGVDAVIHLAALTDVAECEADPAKAFALNVEGSVRWLRAARRAGLQRFVFVSTSHVFAPTSTLERLAPGRTPNPVSIYGQTKAQAEVELLRAGDIDVAVARVFSVIGPNLRAGYLYAELQRRAREKDFSPLSRWANVRDFIEVRSVTSQLLKLERGIYHLGTGVGRTVRDLAEQVMREHGLRPDEYEKMFAEPSGPADYLVAEPSRIE